MRSTHRSAFVRRFSLCLAVALGFFQLVGFAAVKSKNGAERNRQPNSLWQQKSEESVSSRGRRFITPEKYTVYGLNQGSLKEILDQTPLEFSPSARMKEIILEMPAPEGAAMRFRIEESPVLSAELAAQYPDWKTYQGYGIDDPTATARIDWTTSGFRAQILGTKGTFLIDPYQENDRQNYIVYYKRDVQSNRTAFHCDLDKNFSLLGESAEALDYAPEFSTGAQIRTYRLAMAATGEYTNFFRQAGDTDAQAQTRAFNAIVVTVNRVTGIFRRDVAVSLTLVSGTNLVYPNAATDPYANTSGDLSANQSNIDTVIGNANYDMGHLVGTGGGGVASLGVPCRSGFKARGLTGSPSPVGDPFDIDYVVHEMGHQMGANHTFNAASNCGSSPQFARMEAGSAVTIMGYAGICSGISNLQRNSIDNFHIFSQTEAINFVTNGAGSTCGTLSGTNAPPVIAPLTNYSIPFNTPFYLTAEADDADGDALTYSWEQYDAGATPSNYPSSPDDDDTTLASRPLLRPYSPAASPTRIFPSLPYILDNANEPPLTYTGTSRTGSVCAGTCITGEDLPSISRALNFRVAVRDNRGGATDAGMVVNAVNTATPFRVTTQNTAATWEGGSTQTVTWDVSSTNAAPINVANVKISLSTDGGQTFPLVLADSTPNDGSESITVPSGATTQARIKVEAVGNIFFDINNANFTITAATTAVADLGGRILTASGAPVINVTVILYDLTSGTVQSVLTDALGNYNFAGLTTGRNYIVLPVRKHFVFTPRDQSITHTTTRNDVNFTAIPFE